MAQSYSNLEILVCDNCSQDATEEFVYSCEDRRIRYINPRRRLSMSHNWEFAIQNVGTEWVAILGDDDGLLPNAIHDVMEVAKVANVKAVRTSLCNYQWPGVAGIESGILSVPKGVTWELRSSKEWLNRVLTRTGEFNALPVVYTGGFVKTDVLRRISSKCNRVFNSSIPDVFSGIAIALCTAEYLYLHKPVVIGGSSKHSNGRSHLRVNKVRNNLDLNAPAMTFLSEGDVIAVHPRVPTLANGTIPPIGLVYCLESYLQAEALIEDSDGLEMQDFLGRAMASAPAGLDLEAWVAEFATLHDISRRHAQAHARWLKLWKTIRSFPRNIESAMNTMRVGSSVDPISNVFDASLRASQLVDNPTSIVETLALTMKRALLRMTSAR